MSHWIIFQTYDDTSSILQIVFFQVKISLSSKENPNVQVSFFHDTAISRPSEVE